MRAVFLSDAHLRRDSDGGYERLIRFFEQNKFKITHLFILGDFFDFWFCDKEHLYPEFGRMIAELVDMKKAGVEISLFEGNHDFFMASFFDKYGMKVFENDAVIDLDGKRVFLSHGDRVDTKNKGYLLLRRLLRSELFYKVQKIIPSFMLWRIAALSSRTSKNYLAKSPDGLTQKMRTFALGKFGEGIDAVILGHSHQALLEEYRVGGKTRIFSLLGDWISHYTYLTYSDGGFYISWYKGEAPV